MKHSRKHSKEAWSEPQGVPEGALGSEDQYARGAGSAAAERLDADEVRGESPEGRPDARGAGEEPRADARDAGRPAESGEEGGEQGAEAATGEAQASGADAQRAVEEQRERYLRLAAEYDNYRKRMARERQEAGTRAQAELVKLFIDALDDLGRFAHVDPTTVDAATVVQGVELVEKKLLKALGAAGLRIVNPSDEPFDPALHEAVGTEPALSREDDHMVARVYQPGFVLNGQLLRPARVVVKQWNG